MSGAPSQGRQAGSARAGVAALAGATTLAGVATASLAAAAGLDRGGVHMRPGRRARATLAALASVLAAASCQTAQWPVSGPMTSPFGLRMEGAWPDMHRGVDIAAPLGTPVRPLLGGRVRFAGPMSGYGQVVWVDHRDDLLSVYAHLSEVSVAAGQDVDKDTVVGLVGATGVATGPHLHLEVWRWGREVDPVALMGRPPGE